MKDIYREYIGYISSRIYEEYERDSRGCGIKVRYLPGRGFDKMFIVDWLIEYFLVLGLPTIPVTIGRVRVYNKYEGYL